MDRGREGGRDTWYIYTRRKNVTVKRDMQLLTLFKVHFITGLGTSYRTQIHIHHLKLSREQEIHVQPQVVHVLYHSDIISVRKQINVLLWQLQLQVSRMESRARATTYIQAH